MVEDYIEEYGNSYPIRQPKKWVCGYGAETRRIPCEVWIMEGEKDWGMFEGYCSRKTQDTADVEVRYGIYFAAAIKPPKDAFDRAKGSATKSSPKVFRPYSNMQPEDS